MIVCYRVASFENDEFKWCVKNRKMIEYIKGEVADLTPAYCVLETNGIGYMLNISLTTYSELQNLSTARLYVYESIREDAHQLFGFTSVDERAIFLLLISVSGVGANTARMILSSFSAQELKEAIASGDVNAIKTVKGIGLKSAQRIIVDLKDKVEMVGVSTLNIAEINNRSEKASEAVSALVMLGFQAQPSQKVVDKLLKEDPTMTVAKVIKRALSMI